MHLVETATRYCLAILSDEEAKNKLPKDFVRVSTDWIHLWLSKDIFENLSDADLAMVDKYVILKGHLIDLLKIPQFESQLKEKLEQYSVNSNNAINNSNITVQGDFSQSVNHYYGSSPEKTTINNDEIKEAIKKVQKLVSSGQTGKALIVLQHATENKFPSLYKETLQIISAWSDLTRRERVGTISIEEFARMRARINEQVLNTAEEMLASGD